jgi:signal-transduction protein with cAMP-binding, CBS, and nucleotidyltransferase domain
MKSSTHWVSRFDEPASRFAQPPVTIYADDAVRDAAKLMCQKQVGSLVVAERKGEPVGILTEWDLVSRVIAAGKDVEKTTVREVMSSPLIKIEANVKTGDALRLMTNRGIRRVAVYEDGVLEGVLAQSQIVGNRRSSQSLPMVEPIKGHLCAYCNMSFATMKRLEKHIESIHAETLQMEKEARRKEQVYSHL